MKYQLRESILLPWGKVPAGTVFEMVNSEHYYSISPNNDPRYAPSFAFDIGREYVEYNPEWFYVFDDDPCRDPDKFKIAFLEKELEEYKKEFGPLREMHVPQSVNLKMKNLKSSNINNP